MATLSLVIVVALGVGHAVLTDRALDGPGTPALLLLAALGIAGIVAARTTHPRSEAEAGRAIPSR